MKQQFSFKNYTSYGSYGSTSSPVPILERVTQYMIHMVTYGYLTHPHIQLDHHLPQMGSPGSRTIKGARYNAKTLAKPACLASNRRTNVERERSQGIESGILDYFFWHFR